MIMFSILLISYGKFVSGETRRGVFFFPIASITVQFEHHEVTRFGGPTIAPVTRLRDYKGLPFLIGG